MKKESKDFTLEIYKSKKTVFTLKDIALILQESHFDALKSKIHYHVKKGVLNALRNGIYAKPDYNVMELATRIYTPSYVSLETVLQKDGVIFQHYDSVFAVSYLSRHIVVDKHEIIFKKVKDSVLCNPAGILMDGNSSVASKERAFLDAVYLYKNYSFDNLEALDSKKVFAMVPMYNSKVLERKVKSYLS